MTKSSLNILVTCLGGAFALDTMKALRLDNALNIRIMGVDANPKVVNRLFADAFYPVPMASKKPKDFVATLFDVCRRESVDLVIAGADEEVLAISHAKQTFLDAGIRCAVEDSAKVELTRDKAQLFDRLAQASLPLPGYAAVSSLEDLELVASRLGYPDRPFILKPRTGRGARGLILVDARARRYRVGSDARGYGIGNLNVVMKRLQRQRGPLGLMAMEFLSGQVFDVDCVAVNGKPICIVPRRRLWEGPFSRGVEGHQIERNEEIERVTEQIARALSLNYVFDLDFGTRADGRPGLLEVNPRWSGSVAAALAGGVNVPSLLVRSVMGLPIPTVEVRAGYRAVPVTRLAFPDGGPVS